MVKIGRRVATPPRRVQIVQERVKKRTEQLQSGTHITQLGEPRENLALLQSRRTRHRFLSPSLLFGESRRRWEKNHRRLEGRKLAKVVQKKAEDEPGSDEAGTLCDLPFFELGDGFDDNSKSPERSCSYESSASLPKLAEEQSFLGPSNISDTLSDQNCKPSMNDVERPLECTTLRSSTDSLTGGEYKALFGYSVYEEPKTDPETPKISSGLIDSRDFASTTDWALRQSSSRRGTKLASSADVFWSVSSSTTSSVRKKSSSRQTVSNLNERSGSKASGHDPNSSAVPPSHADHLVLPITSSAGSDTHQIISTLEAISLPLVTSCLSTGKGTATRTAIQPRPSNNGTPKMTRMALKPQYPDERIALNLATGQVTVVSKQEQTPPSKVGVFRWRSWPDSDKTTDQVATQLAM